MQVTTRRAALLEICRRPVAVATAAVVLWPLGIAILAIGMAAVMAQEQHFRPVFEYLFIRNEPSAAVLSSVIVVGVLLLHGRGSALLEDAVQRLSRRPHLLIGAITVACAAGAVFVYRRHPLSMDEYAPVFQAGAFARGSLTGKVPPELVSRLIWPDHWFLEASPSGEMLSVYWPGFALLLTPFTLLGCPWLLNPLITGASLFALWHVARVLWPDTTAAGWAVLLAAASPAFVINGMSFYSMPAHLLASTCFVALLLQPTPQRLFWAGVLGSFALSLHNPLPHAAFALPWILSLALQPKRVRNLSALAAGYVPGVVLLCGGWLWVRSRVVSAGNSARLTGGLLEELHRVAFTLPNAQVLWNRTVALLELGLWAVPVLLPLAVLGAVRLRGRRETRLLGASALLTFAAYLLVSYDQGHGWGFRYFHSAWGTLPLLAAGALESGAPDCRPLRQLAAAMSVATLALAVPLRSAQARSFIDAQLAQIPPASSPGREVIFVRPDRGYYSVDLVQNDPFLERDRWILMSNGPRDEERFMSAAFPGARPLARNAIASVWSVP